MHDSARTPPNRFAHHRLDAYRVALDLVVGVESLRFPPGFADHRDQLRRAAAATVRHIAEGANRAHPRDKASRFMVARGEVGECEAALQMAEALGLAPATSTRPLRILADRVAAMLRGLIRRQLADADPPG